MLKALILAVAVMLVAILIPVVHFLSGPLSPFIGGFVGAAALREVPGPAASKGATLGLLMGLMVGAVGVLVVAIVSVVVSAGGVFFLIPVGVGLYTALLGSLGAMMGAARA